MDLASGNGNFVPQLRHDIHSGEGDPDDQRIQPTAPGSRPVVTHPDVSKGRLDPVKIFSKYSTKSSISLSPHAPNYQLLFKAY